MVENLRSGTAKESHLDILEHSLSEESRELARLLLQEHIDSRGDGNVGSVIVSAERTELSHRRRTRRTLNTVFGKICVNRVGYSVRGHRSLFPLDASLNLPCGSFSYGLQRMLARETAKGSFGESVMSVACLTGVRIGKRQALNIVRQCAADFDAFYREQLPNAREDEVGKAPLLILTTDAKGVVMRPESLREETRNRLERSERKLRHRLSKGEKRNRRRMAQTASVYLIDRFIRSPEDIVRDSPEKKIGRTRPRPIGKRIWASVRKEVSEVISDLFSEARRRDPEYSKEWVVLVDGNEHQLDAIRRMAGETGREITIIIDIIHVTEYLWNAARLFFGESDHRLCEEWVGAKLYDILSGKARKVAGSIRMSAAKRNLSERQRRQAERCANYLTKNRQYTDYKTYLRKGYPIGTGVIEGACRYLIGDRMDITGARWSLEGAEAVLRIRSIIKSNDFEEYWKFHLRQEFIRNYASKYQDIGQICSALSS